MAWRKRFATEWAAKFLEIPGWFELFTINIKIAELFNHEWAKDLLSNEKWVDQFKHNSEKLIEQFEGKWGTSFKSLPLFEKKWKKLFIKHPD